MDKAPYDRGFFNRQSELSASSAEVVLPLVFAWLAPRSVVDVGCGTGTWLRVAIDLGVDEVLGVDGDYVDRAELRIEPNAFVAHDLREPLELGRRFDLAICLEVAEHLPPERADSLVADLCRVSDAVLFSAAIPGQGGTEHLNERRQSYWVGLFQAGGWRVFDLVRGRVSGDARVAWWYQQNCFVAATGEAANLLSKVLVVPLFDVVHPDRPPRVQEILRGLGTASKRAARARAERLKQRFHSVPPEP